MKIIDPWIGKRVRASMNGKDWFPGVYEKNVDIFAQYGVRLDDSNEVKFFMMIEPLPDAERGHAPTKEGKA